MTKVGFCNPLKFGIQIWYSFYLYSAMHIPALNWQAGKIVPFFILLYKMFGTKVVQGWGFEAHSLTRLTWLIQTLFLPANWNLYKIFALTGELGQVHMAKKNISDFPPCGKMVIFVTEFVIFLKTT